MQALRTPRSMLPSCRSRPVLAIPPLNLTPQRQKELTITALTRQLLGLACSRPALLLIEDVHWIDATTLEAISRSIPLIKTAPVLLLITFRPEFMPPWLDQSHVTMLRLNRLPREQVGAMVIDVTDGKELPPEVYDQIIRRTDGVPLFVEELTKTVLESGQLRVAGDRYIAIAPLPSLRDSGDPPRFIDRASRSARLH